MNNQISEKMKLITSQNELTLSQKSQNIIPANLKKLIQFACNEFTLRFNQKALIAAYSPGRVNLIGEHTDYNEGFVMPFAIPKYTVIVGNVNPNDESGRIGHIFTLADIPEDVTSVKIDLNDLTKEKKNWADYLKGVAVLHPRNAKIRSFNCLVVSNLPIGKGLSSSAALEVAFYQFLEALYKLNNPLQAKDFGSSLSADTNIFDIAKVCQKAEHEYAGMPCGIMDQLITVAAKENHALLIDCRSLDTKQIPFNYLLSAGYNLLVIDSMHKHALTNSEYSLRRQACELVSAKLGKKSLRDVSRKELESVRKSLQDVHYLCAKHVITENERVLQAAEALQNGDFVLLGNLMNKSHLSLQNDFKVSTIYLDELVQLLNSQEGVLGARLTGAGFGGCVISIVKQSHIAAVSKYVYDYYTGKQKPEFYTFTPVQGAGYIELDNN